MADVGTEPIPGPPGLPVVGNIWDVDSVRPMQSLIRFAEQYGPIFRLHFVGRPVTFVTTNALVNECCDETRFKKSLNGVLSQVRNGVHDGLFTAFGEEPNWGKAHRVLAPAFGPMSIRDMFDEMHDVGSQLALKWARQGPAESIMVTDDFTRLTLDTLALCAMGYRFNSFYSTEMHPFVSAMGEFLVESGTRVRRPPLPAMFYKTAEQKYAENIEIMRKISDGVVKSRKDQPNDRKDLLTAMLEGKDPRTGEGLTDDVITNNLITFMIAGHETTSGMLSFAFYQLLRNPEVYRRAQQEVDDVVGTGPVTVEHMSKLPYIAAILRETLRVNATIPIFNVEPIKDEIIGGKYFIAKGNSIGLMLARSHLDPVVYGDDALEFKPERMVDENFDRLNKEFPNCWKPFGNGARGCIGRPFAWQEALLVMAILLQNFNFIMDDSNYKLSYKETLTVKPEEFYMRAVLREGITPTTLEHRLAGGKVKGTAKAANGTNGTSSANHTSKSKSKGKPLNIYYGSNSGTCEAMANRLAADAPAHGFSADVIDCLDAANQNLPTDRPVVVITASYEGEPPDNAGHFIAWLRSLKGQELEKVSYAVFGCGNHDWAQTFHKIPKLIDASIEQCGGSRIAPLGVTDAAEGNMFEDFEAWEDGVLFPALQEKYGVQATAEDGGDVSLGGLDVQVSTPRTSTLRQDVFEAVVVEAHRLTSEGDQVLEKRHIEVQLPTGVTYSAGDYLAVLPINGKAIIDRAMRRFHLPWDAHLTISSSGQTTLPTNTPVPAISILGAYVELAQPATKRSILALVEATENKDVKAKLQDLATDSYASEITAKRISVLDLLETFPSVNLPLTTFLSLLSPMRVRQYSISSSPLWKQNNVTLSYTVLAAPSLSGHGKYEGVASHYMASLAAGDKLHVSVRPSHAAFHLPNDSETVPVVMIAAGTGLAPFRGFIQERAAMIGAGRKVAPAMLFFGCRGRDDDIYREEFDHWEAMGAIDVRRAYSRRDTDGPDAKGCRYVQDRLFQDRQDLVDLWHRDARVYACGSRKAGESIKKTVVKICLQEAEKHGLSGSEEKAAEWVESMRNVRYAVDVFD